MTGGAYARLSEATLRAVEAMGDCCTGGARDAQRADGFNPGLYDEA